MKQSLLKFSVAGLVLLAMCCPIHIDAAIVTWIGGSGDWDTAANWSTGALPSPSDNVVIPAGPSITVIHSTGSDTVSGIVSYQQFTLSGGSLAVSNTFLIGTFLNLSGGTLVGGTVQATNGGSIIVGAQGGSLDRVTVDGVLDVGNTYSDSVLSVTNG